MTKETLAAQLNGRSMGDEISDSEERAAKRDSLVVVFGYSDDCAEFRGVIHDEVGCYDGGEFMLDRAGLKQASEEEVEVLERFGFLKVFMAKSVKIEGNYGSEGWTFKTDLPHATFDIMEDGERFCRGIVFSINDMPE